MDPMRRRPHLKDLLRKCETWNRLHPIGTAVDYHPVIYGPEFRRRVTRSEAYVLSGHTAVIFLEGERGCVALDACDPVAELPEAS